MLISSVYYLKCQALFVHVQVNESNQANLEDVLTAINNHALRPVEATFQQTAQLSQLCSL